MTPPRTRPWLEGAALALVLLLGVGSWLGGVRAVPVLTGSMTPVAPAGSLVLTTRLAPQDVERGEVVAFAPPAAFNRGRPVMHRVAEVITIEGVPAMRTKGDANPGQDPWTVALPGADLARARLVLPFVGHLVAGGPFSAMLLAGGVVLLALGGSWALALRRDPGAAAEPDGAAPAAPLAPPTSPAPPAGPVRTLSAAPGRHRGADVPAHASSAVRARRPRGPRTLSAH